MKHPPDNGMQISTEKKTNKADEKQFNTNNDKKHSERERTWDCEAVQIPWEPSSAKGFENWNIHKSSSDYSSNGKTRDHLERQKHHSQIQDETPAWTDLLVEKTASSRVFKRGLKVMPSSRHYWWMFWGSVGVFFPVKIIILTLQATIK